MSDEPWSASTASLEWESQGTVPEMVLATLTSDGLDLTTSGSPLTTYEPGG
jgi:hypothetical protein